MILSKRERLIMVLTLAAVSILVLDRYVLTPLLDGRSSLQARKARLQGDMERANRLLTRRRQIDQRWNQMLTSSLKRDPGEAESQILHALGNWSEQTGLNLSSIRPERSTEKTDVREITFHISGSGSMNSISWFVWCLETAEIPIKVKVLSLGSRKEGTDDLSLQLRFSTLCLAVQAPPAVMASVQNDPKGADQ